MAKGIGDVIYSLLSNDIDVSAIVGTKIYPYVAIENIKYDYIVYDDMAVEPTQCKGEQSSLDTVTVQIELYTETLADLEDLGNKVRTLLDRYSGTVETVVVQSISFTAEDSGYADEDRVYLKIQSYSFRILK